MLDTLTALIRRWHVKTHKPFGKSSPGGLRISVGADMNPEGGPRPFGRLADADCGGVPWKAICSTWPVTHVSPGEQFRIGGARIDKAIDDFHGGEAQKAVTAAIAEQFFGELPVGAALIVKTLSRRLPFVVAAPTMRIPGNVAGTINAYLSMRAALIAILRHNATGGPSIRSLLVPGLCTGVGGMPYVEASEQMRTAYDNVIEGRWRQVVHAAMAPYAMCGKRVIWTERTDK